MVAVSQETAGAIEEEKSVSYSTSEFVPPPPEFTQFAGQLASTRKLKLADSKVNIHKIDFDDSKSARLRRAASTVKIKYQSQRLWIQHVIIIFIAFLSLIIGIIWRPLLCVGDDSETETSGNDSEAESSCFLAFFANSTLDSFVFFNMMIISVSVYFIYSQRATDEQRHARSLKAYVLSADRKRRLIVFLETLLICLMHSVIMSSEHRGVKGLLTLFCLIIIGLLAVITFAKRWHILNKIPVKSPDSWSKTYIASYCMSIFALFMMTFHAISVSSKQYLVIYSYVGLSFLWMFWANLYHSEVVLFVNDLNEIPSLRIVEQEKDERLIKSVDQQYESVDQQTQSAKRRDFPTTFGALVLFNELVMASTFLVFIICCTMASRRYDGATGNGDRFCLAIYLMISLAMFINSVVAHLSMQSMNQKRYKAAAFNPLLKDSLLTHSP